MSGSIARSLYALVISTALAAAGSSPSQAASTSLAEESILFVDIPSVYGASKYEQAAADAPSSVSIITADEIRKYGYRTLADILRSVRGFFVTYDRNYSYVGVRGFGRPGDYNSRILVLVDGHRLNDNVYDGVLVGTDGLLDVDLIRHVEIIRGPSSSLHGTSAFFGVINLVTKRGRDVEVGEVSVSAASYDTYKTRVTLGKRLLQGPELLVSASYYDSDGRPRLYYPEFDTPATNNGVAEDVDADRYGSGFAKLTVGDLSLHGGYYSRTKTVPTGSYGSVFNDPRNETVDGAGFVELKVDRQWHSRSRTMARLYYDTMYYDGRYVFDYALPGDPPNLVVNRDRAEGTWWGAEITMVQAIGRAHRALIGAEYKSDLEQEQKNYDVSVYLDDKRRAKNWAVYVQDEITVRQGLVVSLGVRYDCYDTFGSSTNPRLALIYSRLPETTVKVLYGQAFRAPNSYELYYQDVGVQKANPDLDPEMMRSAELVVERSLFGNLLGVVSLFQYRIDDLISFEIDPNDGLLVFRNADAIETRGAELELDGRWMEGLEGRVSYAYQRTRDERTGERLTNSPEHLAKANVIVALVRDVLFVGLEAQHTSARRTLADRRARAATVTNATVFGLAVQRRLHLSLSVYNVFGTDYADPGSQEHLQDLIEQDGRTLRANLTYAF